MIQHLNREQVHLHAPPRLITSLNIVRKYSRAVFIEHHFTLIIFSYLLDLNIAYTVH